MQNNGTLMNSQNYSSSNFTALIEEDSKVKNENSVGLTNSSKDV
jgi:hypothetical protein